MDTFINGSYQGWYQFRKRVDPTRPVYHKFFHRPYMNSIRYDLLPPLILANKIHQEVIINKYIPSMGTLRGYVKCLIAPTALRAPSKTIVYEQHVYHLLQAYNNSFCLWIRARIWTCLVWGSVSYWVRVFIQLISSVDSTLPRKLLVHWLS